MRATTFRSYSEEIPECRVDADDFGMGVGMGWPAALESLKEYFAKIFEPVLPPTGFLEGIDAELEVRLHQYHKDKEEAEETSESSLSATLRLSLPLKN
jgi:hypothetical protein